MDFIAYSVLSVVLFLIGMGILIFSIYLLYISFKEKSLKLFLISIPGLLLSILILFSLFYILTYGSGYQSA